MGTQRTQIYRLQDNQWVLWASGEGAGFGVGGTYAAAELDDGTGTALWIGGDIGQIEGVTVSGIARYRPGLGWDDGGGRMDSVVIDFQTWDDGNGPALYTSGEFTHINGKLTNRVARWDPKAKAWKPLGKGLNQIASLGEYDDGQGSALWAFGAFDSAGGKAIKKIARWDGKDWTGLEGVAPNGGIGHAVGADFGDGPTMYMVGAFSYVDNYNSGGFAAYHFCPPPACPPDLDRSGSLDLFDFLTFLNLFNAQDPAADCDADGAFTITDFTCYSALFAAGC